MNKNSSLSPNIRGGFIGGVLGILAFAFFQPLLPVGCLLGVLIGFYWQELGVLIANDYRKTVERWRSLTGGIGIPLLAIMRKRSVFSAAWRFIVRSAVGEVRHLFSHFVTKPLVGACGFIKRGIRFLIKWPSSHPMNQAYIMTAAAMLSFALVQSLWIIPSVFLLSESGWFLLLMFAALVAFVTVVVHHITYQGHTTYQGLSIQDDMRTFYLMYEEYAANGGLHYYFSEVYRLFRTQVFATGLVVTLLLSLGVNIVLFFTLMLIPAIVAVLAIKGLYRFAMMKSHWPCFAVTCGVTVLTVLVAPTYVAVSGSSLWLIALVNGSICALSSEILCKLFRKGFARSYMLRRIGEEDVFENGWDEKFLSVCFKPFCWVQARLIG